MMAQIQPDHLKNRGSGPVYIDIQIILWDICICCQLSLYSTAGN